MDQPGFFLRLCKLCLAFMDKRGKMKRDLHSVDGSQVVIQSLLKTIALIALNTDLSVP
jgi:hypothetical protein